MTDTPTLAQVIKNAIEARLLEVHTSMPGLIVSFDKKTCLAYVQPALKRKYKGEDPIDLPVIPNVPVMFPRGGGAAMEFDLQKDDPVILHFSERSIDTWISTGGKVDPKDPRKHHLSDAFAYPGGYPSSKPIAKEKIVVSFTKDGAMKAKNQAGFFQLDKDGNFSIDNGGLAFKFGKGGKVSAKGKNSGIDFFAQLLLVIDKLVETTKVATAMGLQPFIPDPTYLSEREKLDPFKE